jgi:hypothetical protein
MNSLGTIGEIHPFLIPLIIIQLALLFIALVDLIFGREENRWQL